MKMLHVQKSWKDNKVHTCIFFLLVGRDYFAKFAFLVCEFSLFLLSHLVWLTVSLHSGPELCRLYLIKVRTLEIDNCEIRNQFFPKLYHSSSFHSPSCELSLTSAKEGKRGERRGRVCYAISDLHEAKGKDKGDFTNAVVAPCPEQQRRWCQSLELGKDLCAKLAFSLGVGKSVMVPNFWCIAQIPLVLSSFLTCEW